MKLASLAGHCAELMQLIWDDERPASLVINFYFRARKYLGARDRSFIAEAVYHALRNRRRLEWLTDRFQERYGDLVASRDRTFLVFLISLFEDTDPERRAALAQAVSERDEIPDGARFLQKITGFLDHPETLPWPDEPRRRLAVETSLPDWLVDRMIDMLGADEARALAGALNRAAPVMLRINPMKAPRAAVQAALESEGFPCEPTAYSPFGLTLKGRANVFPTEAFQRGWFEIQDEASQIVSLCVDPKPGSKTLDACAGGGGKALHLSALMKGRGEILAMDIHKRRLDSLRDRARRNDCQNIRVRLLQEEGDLPDEVLRRQWDYVLIDAPCTGMGVLRRNPDARWKTTPAMVGELAAKQAGLLERFAPTVAPGGRLAYATCSILEDENEAVADAFLKRHPEFAPGDVRASLERYGLERLAPRGGHCLRMWPHVHGTDGFFVALFHRRERP